MKSILPIAESRTVCERTSEPRSWNDAAAPRRVHERSLSFAPLFLLIAGLSNARAFERFNDIDPNTEALEIWRITDDRNVRHHSNYHNVDPFSFDGRFLLHTITEPPLLGEMGRGKRPPPTFAIYDLREKREVFRASAPAVYPIWARSHHTVFWVAGLSPGADRTLCRAGLMNGRWVDSCEDRRIRRMPGRVESVTPDDRYLLGVGADENDVADAWLIWRIRPDSILPPEVLYRASDFPRFIVYEPRCHPADPILLARRMAVENSGRSSKRSPGRPTKVILGLDGTYKGAAIPEDSDGAHLCWSGDGALLARGDGPIRVRSAPFVEPGDWRIASTATTSDVSPCGSDGQWLIGIEGVNGTLFVANTSTAYTRLICHAASIIHQPAADRRDLSGAFDSDAYGSPDGTKVYFSTNYNLRDFPVTRTKRRVLQVPVGQGRHTLEVDSTAGFPERGVLSVWTSLVQYEGREADRFLNCEWGYARTPVAPAIEPGTLVTDFRGRVGDTLSADPLLRQAATDVYIAVIRMPDPPVLERNEKQIVVRPGVRHRETAAIRLFLNGTRLYELSRDGDTNSLNVENPGTLTAIAVEWSGLQSPDSNAVDVLAGDRLQFGPPLRSVTAAPLSPTVTTDETGAGIEQWQSPDGWIVQEKTRKPDGSTVRRLFRAPGQLFATEVFGAAGRRTEETVLRIDGKLMERTRFEGGVAIEREELRYGVYPHHMIRKGGRWEVVQP